MADLQSLIDQLWDFDDPAQSEVRFRDELAKQHTPSEVAELRTQLARALGLQRQFDKAHAELNAVEESLRTHEHDRSFDLACVRMHLERGRVFNSSKQRDRALIQFSQAFELAQGIDNDHLAIDAAHMIAIVHGALDHHDLALEWNLKAIELASESSQARARKWLGSLHNNLGWTFHAQNDFTKALKHFELAFEARQRDGTAKDQRIARWCIARCLRSLGRVEEALVSQRQLHHEAESGGGASHGFVHEELGECLLALQRHGEAAPHFAQAYELLQQDQWLASTQPQRLKRLLELAGRARLQ